MDSSNFLKKIVLSVAQNLRDIYFRGVHGYTDEGGELKNKWKGVFEEALVK